MYFNEISSKKFIKIYFIFIKSMSIIQLILILKEK